MNTKKSGEQITNGSAKQNSKPKAIEIKSVKIDPMVGGVLGAVAGAAIGSAAVALFRDEKTRKRVMEQFEGLKKTLQELKEDEYIREKVSNYLGEGKKSKKKGAED